MRGRGDDPIPIAGPWITERETERVAEAVTHGWYGNANAFQAKFESAFANYLGVKFATCLPSGTSALHLSLAGLGVGPGDEVIVPEATWIGSSAPISYVGATPVFADVDERTWCLDARAFERALSPRTKAVIVVDLYGNMPDVEAIGAIARRHGVRIIEDAAQAVGSTFANRPAGTHGDAGVFSFHGSKTLTTGEGGLLATDDPLLHERVQILRDHGRRPGDRTFTNLEVAFKYRMTAMQAALGLAQLERIDELVARKREIFAWYRARLGATDGLTLNHEAPGTLSTFWMVTVLMAPGLGLTKERVKAELLSRGVESRPFFHPLSALPAYRHLGGAAAWQRRNPVAYALSPWGINLPSGFNMTEALVERVACGLREIVAGAPRRGEVGTLPEGS